MLYGAIKYWKGVDNVFRFVKFVFETGVKFEANLKEIFDSVMARSRLRKSRDSLLYLYFLQEKINSPTILQVN